MCADFQKGKCSAQAGQCPKGAHKCGKVLKTDRVCGMLYHGGEKCRRA